MFLCPAQRVEKNGPGRKKRGCRKRGRFLRYVRTLTFFVTIQFKFKACWRCFSLLGTSEDCNGSEQPINKFIVPNTMHHAIYLSRRVVISTCSSLAYLHINIGA